MDSWSDWDDSSNRRHWCAHILSNIESRRPLRILVLLWGIVASQCVLYGPSLLGDKLLLPLDCLSHANLYLPTDWKGVDAVQSEQKWVFGDAILQVELDRIFAVREVREGRLPFWNPYNYCGVPFLANNNSAVFSPFMIPSYLWPGPEVLAWTQMLRALVAGIGTYLFFRHTMGFGFLPALLGGWAFPLSGFLIMWSWIHFSSVVSLLPWILIATDRAVRGPIWRGVPLLALATALVLLSGKLDTSAHVLLASGLFAIYRLAEQYRLGALARRPLRRLLAPAAGWLLGFGLAAPIVLPTQDYLQTSNRIAVRAQGVVDFPTHGPRAMLPLVLPYIFGDELQSFVGYGNVLESTAIGYAGFVTALLLVPLGWSRRRRFENLFWCLAGLFALATHVKIPGVSDVYSLPLLNLLKNNRFVFFTTFCLIAMGVAGIETLQQRERPWRWWLWIVGLGVLGLGGWCAVSLKNPAADVVAFGDATAAAFQRRYWEGLLLSGLTLLLLVGICRFNRFPHVRAAGLVLVVLAELIYQAYGFVPQSSPKLYYPQHPLLSEAARSGPGRICSVHDVMAPSLNRTHWVPCIKGYDGADPSPLMRLLRIANPNWVPSAPYAETQNFAPEFSPILAMLNVRYRLGERPAPSALEPVSVWEKHWLHTDGTELPRPYVPHRVVPVQNQEMAFELISRPEFDPRDAAYVEAPPEYYRTAVQGTADLLHEDPGKLTIQCHMETPGLIVLSDCWYPGWSASYAGMPVTVTRVNGALIGVQVPAGEGLIELSYRPRRWLLGCTIMGLSVVTICLWFCVGSFQQHRDKRRLLIRPERTDAEKMPDTKCTDPFTAV